MRRAIDMIFAIFLLSLTSPLMVLIAILIKIDSPGPLFYTPQMIGRHGRLFRLFRFRTMKTASVADSLPQTLTRVGSVIRNYSLDHLPMLLNLFTGDLTIIGPRPMEHEVIHLENPRWQQDSQSTPGMFNYAVLKLGSAWNATRVLDPTLNDELEQAYLSQRTFISDLRLFWSFLQAYIVSKGNVKARGRQDRALVKRLNRCMDGSKKE